ncbi:MAG: acetylxylan esterase [Chloroflexota bacterium]|nr:acetylxylan esterase [Chloroflexota bacterium]
MILLSIATGIIVAGLSACAPTRVGPTPTPRPTYTPAPTIPVADLIPLFDYDSEADLDIERAGVEYRDQIAVHDISYASPMKGRVTAYLVVPPGEGPFAGILFAHPSDGSRGSFLEEAVWLAKAGTVSLLVDSPWARPEPWQRGLDYTPANDRDMYTQEIVDLRRALDLLTSLEEVDPERVGFIGYSYGAHIGGVLSGVETRIKAYVFVAGVPSRSDRIPRHIASALPAEDLIAYLEATRPLDAIHYVGHAAPAALFFQCAREDEIIAEETSWRYYEAGSQPKKITWYDTGHGLHLNQQARLDRARRMAEQIGLDESALE